jgi:hypothetical protein
MLGSALGFAAVFTGTWGALKNAALSIGSLPWLAYAAAFLILNLVLLPASFTLAVWLWKNQKPTQISLRRAIADKSQILLPLGLFAWIAFTISFVLPKFAYVLATLSDPLGWGWNLLGSPEVVVNADQLGLAPLIQVAALLVGLYWSVSLTVKLDRSESRGAVDWKRAAPLVAFSLVYTLLMLWLLVG